MVGLQPSSTPLDTPRHTPLAASCIDAGIWCKTLLHFRSAWQEVSTDSLKFHLGPPCPTLLRPAGGPPLKRPYSRFWGGLPAGRAVCGRLLPPWIALAVRDCFTSAFVREATFGYHGNPRGRESKPNHRRPKSEANGRKSGRCFRGLPRPVRRGVSKGVEDSRRPPVLRAGIERSGLQGPGETLVSP
jgi:hypothetical protein